MRLTRPSWQAFDDAAILATLVSSLENNATPAPEPTVYIPEFALFGGEVRADLAVLGECLDGYEIKSARDDLSRLPTQAHLYSAVFDRITLVSADSHLGKARKIVPNWWGLVSVCSEGDSLDLVALREPKRNPRQRPEALASLLWREEILRLLMSLGLAAGIKTKPTPHLVERLTSSMAAEQVADAVRQALRARGDWRAGARQKRDDGKFQQLASWSGSQRVFRGRSRR